MLAAIFAPLIAPFDPNKTSMIYRLKPIGYRQFLLGTDELGRDMLSRLIYGGRMSLMMGLVPVAFATGIGGFLGVVAGFFGGWVNMLIMRMIDVFYAFPSVLLAVAISGTMGGGIGQRSARADPGVHPAALPRRRDRDRRRCATSISSRRRARAAPPTWSIIFHHVLRNILGAGLHLRVEPDLGLDPAGRPACRSSASASSRRRRTGA